MKYRLELDVIKKIFDTFIHGNGIVQQIYAQQQAYVVFLE